ncbi:MAG: extracellular solute-binding protein [Chloroflexi bacterium]|nr:extracellular solute-binding protein [Chloroflexota bacterium]
MAGRSRRAFIQQAAVWTQSAGMGAALTACVPFRAGSAGESQPAASPVTATVLAFNNPIFLQPKDEFLAALAEVDPGLRPDIIVFPGLINEFREKVLTIYAGGDLPDAQWIHPTITTLMASQKLVLPLDDFARRDRATSLSDFYQGVLDFFRWRGTAYALPWSNNGHAYVFNRTLCESLGVTPPDRLEKDGKWSWDNFVSTLRGLTRGTAGSADRTIGFLPAGYDLDYAVAWVWSNGGEVFSKDLKNCLLNAPAATEAIQGWADLYLKHQVVNYGPHTSDFPNGFYSGRVGLWLRGKGSSPEVTQRAQFGLGVVPLSKGKAGRISSSGPLAFGVLRGGPHGAEAGWRWVRFMAGPQAAAILMKRRTVLPVRPRFAQLPVYDQSMEPWEDKAAWSEASATARALQQPVSYQDIARLWRETFQNILDRKGPVKSLLDDLVRQVNAILAQEKA